VPKLTVTVITRNEAANIEAAIASASWADEIVVVDADSTDDTAAIARRHGARVETRAWAGYSAQKNYAASIASHDWILSIDADERVTPALATEIARLLATEPGSRGYRMPRVTWYLGRWIRTTDWYPDYQLRLYDRRSGEWNGRRVHESIRLKAGEPGRLANELQHFAYRDISEHLATIDAYTTLASEQWSAEGRRASVAGLVGHPVFAFFRNYVVRRGFLDGVAGLIVSILNSYYVFLKTAKLWERQTAARADSTSRVPHSGSRIPDSDHP
jgi:glycosyltransferase involved in cell wall biosynthesis